MKILLIHPRKGLFRLTICQKCSHIWSCEQCTAKLIVHQVFSTKMNLVCHQCQTVYDYPKICPQCSSTEILSGISGIDDLAKILEQDLKLPVFRLDLAKNYKQVQKLIQIENSSQNQIYLATRVFDPAVDYQVFEKIIFIQAENLLASPDYLVVEETIKNLAEIIQSTDGKSRFYFDSASKNLELLQNLTNISANKNTLQTNNFVLNWYLKNLEKEIQNRKKFGFPPFVNLLLITSQDKIKTQAHLKAQEVWKYLQSNKNEFSEIEFETPYPAKMLKRKGFYSYHVLVKYPRNYDKFTELQKIVLGLKQLYRLQVRVNPRHTF